MSHPTDLADIVRTGLGQLATDPAGCLSLHTRRGIWTSFGPFVFDDRERAVPCSGLVRRVHLAVLAVRHVLPLWEKHFREDRQLHDMLEIAQAYVHGDVAYDMAHQANEKGWFHADNVSAICFDRKDDPGQRAAFVCYAASKAVVTALYDEILALHRLEHASEADIDPYELDAASYAAAAIAGGHVKAKDASTDRRREFWRWYLEAAVPLARDAA
jgi:hypothetical protein